MAIRWDKFTVKSQEAMQNASTLAVQNGNPELLPIHLLAVLLEDKEGIIVPVLQKIGVPTDRLQQDANRAVAGLPKVSGSSAQPGMSNALQKVVDRAFKEAEEFKDEYVSTEHLLLSLATEERPCTTGDGSTWRDARRHTARFDCRPRDAARHRSEP